MTTLSGDVRMAVFARLDAATLYGLLRLRSQVFVVEQQCAYPDMDGRDVEAATRHLWIEDGDRPLAYLRLLRDDDGTFCVGRVVTAPDARGRGLAGSLLRRALEVAVGCDVHLGAQSHLERWYERFGFARTGADYMEDGIPHVPMRLMATAVR